MDNKAIAVKDLAKGMEVTGCILGEPIFTGYVDTIRDIKGRSAKLVRLEDAKKNYHLFWDNEAAFYYPEDAPKHHVMTDSERKAEPVNFVLNHRG